MAPTRFASRVEYVASFGLAEVDRRCARTPQFVVNANLSSSGNGGSSRAQSRNTRGQAIMAAHRDRIDDLLDQFVGDLHVKTKATSYRSAVRKFHRSFGKNGCLKDLSEKDVR